jgi:hypothetical protein
MPACFREAGYSEKGWQRWLALAKRARVTFCRDCRPAFKRMMEAHGACAWPGVVFRVVRNRDGEAEVVGKRPRS